MPSSKRANRELIVSGAATLLSHHRYWRFNAFKEQPDDIKLILSALQGLSERELWTLDQDINRQAAFFGRYFPALFEWLAKVEPSHQPVANLVTPPIPFWLHTDVPGRKWQQIQQFCAALPTAEGNGRDSSLEWCAGKGHLGRLRSWQQQQSVFSVERDTHLCVKGQVQAQKLDLAQHFINADVFKLPLSVMPSAPYHWLALHACGELHCEFLRVASGHKAHTIALAPCCYHRQTQTHYRPLSRVAQETHLGPLLDAQALRLAQQDQATAGHSERSKRATELNWRLGYEALRKTIDSQTAYRNLPSTKQHAFIDFADFCHWAAQHHNIALPAQANWRQFEQDGQQARIDMMRRDAIRHCFRRPLELWLTLDKAAYLEEQGYQTTLRRFCEPQVTPRNLLLIAKRGINTA